MSTIGESSRSSKHTGVIIGAVVGGIVLLILFLLAGLYAIRQKRKAKSAKDFNPFGKILVMHFFFLFFHLYGMFMSVFY